MSFEGLTFLLPVLFLVVIGIKVVQAMRRRSDGWRRVEGTIVAARIGENDAGSGTDYFPVLSLAYTANGTAHRAENVAAARATHRDLARVEALLEGPLKPGAAITLAHDPRAPARVMIV